MTRTSLLILMIALIISCSAGRSYDRVAKINDIGIECLKNKMYQDAVFWFEKTLEIDSSNEAALNNLGICYEALGQYKEAMKYYDKAYSISGNSIIKANIDSLNETLENEL